MDNSKNTSDSLYSSFLNNQDKKVKQKEGFFNVSTGKLQKLKPKIERRSVGENKYTKMKLAKPTDSGFRLFRKNVSNFAYKYSSPFRKLFSFVGSGAVGKQVIMLVPENTGKTVSLPITNIFLLVMFFIVAVIGIAGTISYKRFSDERQMLSNLNRINRYISTDVRKYSSAIGHLRTKMSTYQSSLAELATLVSHNDYEAGHIADSHNSSSYADNIKDIDKSVSHINKSLSVIDSFYDSRANYRGEVPLGWPVADGGRITSGFGERSNPFTMKISFHAGIDIAGAEGTPIVSVADGVVKFSGWRDAYGWFVIIQHKNGYQTGYAHNSLNRVVAGERIRKGQIIAEMGKTGRVTGVHSHFEVRINDSPVQPAEYISTRF